MATLTIVQANSEATVNIQERLVIATPAHADLISRPAERIQILNTRRPRRHAIA
jgi:hypothetical protein